MRSGIRPARIDRETISDRCRSSAVRFTYHEPQIASPGMPLLQCWMSLLLSVTGKGLDEEALREELTPSAKAVEASDNRAIAAESWKMCMMLVVFLVAMCVEECGNLWKAVSSEPDGSVVGV